MIWIVVAVLGIGIYLFITAKTRRGNAMRREVIKVIQSGKDMAVDSGISYQSARKYALDCGAQDKKDTDLITCEIALNNKVYLVTAYEAPSGSAGLFVKDKEIQDREEKKERIKMHREMGYSEEQVEALEERIQSNRS